MNRKFFFAFMLIATASVSSLSYAMSLNNKSQTETQNEKPKGESDSQNGGADVEQAQTLDGKKDANAVRPQALDFSKNRKLEKNDCFCRNGFADIVEKVLPGVVSITTTQIFDPNDKKQKTSEDGDESHGGMGESPLEDLFRDFFRGFEGRGLARRVHGLGSGFFIKIEGQTGYIITSNHVIAHAKKISVYLSDKTEIDAKLHARDERTDIAVLKVNLSKLSLKKRQKIRALSWGNSDAIRVGDPVVAIGNPFGLGNTVTAGIVSAKKRDIIIPGKGRLTEYVDDFMQISAPINPGNSGGCSLNLDGEVVGINTAILSPGGNGGNVGVGFCIPSGIASKTVNELILNKRTKRGWFGVMIRPVDDNIADSLGLKDADGDFVEKVNPNSPAERSGIKQRDIIIEYDGKIVNEQNSLQRLVGETKVGTQVKVKVRRGKKELELFVTVGEFEEEVKKEKKNNDLDINGDGKSTEAQGLTLTAIPKEVLKKLSQKGVSGIFVKAVSPVTAASESLKSGDIIQSVSVEYEQFEMKEPSDFVQAIKTAKKKGKRNVLLLVSRRQRLQSEYESFHVALNLETAESTGSESKFDEETKVEQDSKIPENRENGKVFEIPLPR